MPRSKNSSKTSTTTPAMSKTRTWTRPTLRSLLREQNYDRLGKLLDRFSQEELICLNKAAHGAVYRRLEKTSKFGDASF